MRGGYRAGSGRKEGFAAKNAEEARRILSELVMTEMKPIGQALIAKAKRGDIQATRELFDRAFGKAPHSLGVDANGQVPRPILMFDPSFSTNEELEQIVLEAQSMQ